ncbi:MAG: KH domain-containing protein [Clostridia bacterium]|nr:KH domain-containing protein [Clostridia bacterium]
MRELLEFIAKSMVTNPDAVEVTQNEKETAIVLQLHVAEEDMGKVIGKQGRIAKAIRTVMKAATGNEGKKVIVDIV